MDFEIIALQTFTNVPEKEYINECCVGCDEILYKLKDNLALAMNIDADNLIIYQEDWGWALEFSKDDVFYFLVISNLLEVDKNKTLFSVGTNAKRKVKKLISIHMIEDEVESNKLSETVKKSVEKNGFTVI